MNKPEPLFNRLALIGAGLIGSSIARAARAQGAARTIVATARSPKTRRRGAELGLADQGVESNAAAVEGEKRAELTETGTMLRNSTVVRLSSVLRRSATAGLRSPT